MKRSHPVTLSICLLSTLLGCSDQQSASTPDETAGSADTESGPVEGAAPPQSTHWLNENPTGLDAAPVSQAMLAEGNRVANRWIQYGGDYANHRHSPIMQLNRESVANLQVAWAFPTGTLGQFEVSPIIYDGVMYVTSSYNRLFALDATSGELIWRYDHVQPDDLRLCCGPINRGVAISGDTVLMATLDARLLAFHRKTGQLLWDTTIANYQSGFSTTSAPLVVKNLAIIGVAGGEYGVRGFFDAYDIGDGHRVWRHSTLPSAGQPGAETWAGDSYLRGGSPAWTTGAYDPEADVLYWTTGNPAPDWNGDARAGDNLYSNSLLAVNPNTGERLWHFQFTPHDVWDYDGNSQIFLVDISYGGRAVKAVVQANRNGFFYILDRSNGEFLSATTYLEQVNWATVDDNGRPDPDPAAYPTETPSHRVCPGNIGGTNGAWAGAYNPELKTVFVSSVEACQLFYKGISVYIEGNSFLGGGPLPTDRAEGKAYGNVSAIDVRTGQVKWRYRDEQPMMAGTLSTAGGVVFSGNLNGNALALDAEDGRLLWKFKMGGGVRSQPVAYEIDGKAYVAIGSGSWSQFETFTGGPSNIPEGGHLFVFAIP
jgi:alcohol dehydrogenase (cytochrome c)|tara:strand:+ start:233 stop:2023 length:1791 start_codon:yes stop_codon:yes gene_type:complete